MTDSPKRAPDHPFGPFTARHVIEVCAAVILIVGAVAVVVVLSEHGFVDMSFPGSRILKRDFVFDQPNTVPKWVASSLALGCAVLAGVVARLDRRRRRWWFGLAAIFAVVSVDKVAGLHDGTLSILRGLGLNRTDSSLIAIILAGLAAAVYLPFVIRLPPRVRTWFTAAGIVFFTGELALDLAGGWYRSVAGPGSLGYSVFTTLEGLFEVTGLALFAYAVAINIQMFGLRLVAEPPEDE